LTFETFCKLDLQEKKYKKLAWLQYVEHKIKNTSKNVACAELMEKGKKTYFEKQDKYFIVTRNVLESSAQQA
jgi:hypothetical protein